MPSRPNWTSRHSRGRISSSTSIASTRRCRPQASIARSTPGPDRMVVTDGRGLEAQTVGPDDKPQPHQHEAEHKPRKSDHNGIHGSNYLVCYYLPTGAETTTCIELLPTSWKSSLCAEERRGAGTRGRGAV